MGEFVVDAVPVYGLGVSEKVARVMNGTGTNRFLGEILALDISLTVATNFKEGDPKSAWYIGVQPIAPNDGHLFAVLLKEDIPAGRDGEAYLWGDWLPALYEPGTGPVAPGQVAGAAGGAYRLRTIGLSAQAKAIAVARQSTAQLPAGSLMRVFFNGIYGIGKG